MRRMMTSQRGFSLIEAMIAFGILAVGMMAVGSMITTSMRFDKQAIGKREAYNLAMDKFEELKGNYIMTVLSADPATIEEDVEQWVGGGGTDATKKKRLTPFRRRTVFVTPCVRCVAGIGTGQNAIAYEVKITVGWGESASCTKTNPAACPNSTVFSNYIFVRRSDTPACTNPCP